MGRIYTYIQTHEQVRIWGFCGRTGFWVGTYVIPACGRVFLFFGKWF